MAIALVAGQTASAALGSVNSGNVVLTNNPTTGNFVAVCVTKSDVTATITVADTNGNSYTQVSLSPAGVSGVGRAYIFYLANAPANASKTITITANSVTDMNAWAGEYSGVATSTPVDTTAVKTSATTGTAINLPTATAANNGSLYIGCCVAAQSISTANSPWTGIGVVRQGNYAEYYIQPTAGAQAMAFTQSPSGSWASIVAIFKPATGSNKTLAADAGSYALTGTAAALKLGRVVAAAVGSYALTGTAATLRRNLPLVASAGSYSLTGATASLLHGWKVAAGAGSYSISGTAATLRAGKTLAAAAGSYALSGSAASLLHAYKVTAGAGSYSLSGTAANLKVGKAVAAAAGSYSLTGTAATPKAGKVVAAASGSYALIGSNAALLKGWRVSASVGSYSITGSDATLTKSAASTYTLIAGAGSYALTGSSASLLVKRLVAANSGSYALSGSPVTLRLGTEQLTQITSSGRASVGTSYAYKTLTQLREEERQRLNRAQKQAQKAVAAVIRAPGILSGDLTAIVRQEIEQIPQYQWLTPEMINLIVTRIEAQFRRAFIRKQQEDDEDDDEAFLLVA